MEHPAARHNFARTSSISLLALMPNGLLSGRHDVGYLYFCSCFDYAVESAAGQDAKTAAVSNNRQNGGSVDEDAPRSDGFARAADAQAAVGSADGRDGRAAV